MIIIYETVDDYNVNRQDGESSERVISLSRAPFPGDTVCMGNTRMWEVITVEIYLNGADSVALALVHPAGEDIPSRAAWRQVKFKQDYPPICMNLKLMPDGEVLHYGWSMTGKAPTGRLYGGTPTNHPTLLKDVPLPWAFDMIDTYKPTGESSFTAIHVCHCVPVDLPEMAVV